MIDGTRGRTKRLGVIVPSTNTVVERDFAREVPDHVTVHVSRMYIEENTASGEHHMLREHLPKAARDLATCKPDVVIFACTSAGALLGEEGDRALIANLSEQFNAPVVSTNEAVSRALVRRKISRPAVVTPYVKDLTNHIVASLVRHSIEPPLACSMDMMDPFAIAEIQAEQIVEFAKLHLTLDDIDGIFVSCTNLRGIEARDALMEWSGLPVVTSNQAALEEALAEMVRGTKAELAK